MQDCCQICGKALKFDGFSEIYGIDYFSIHDDVLGGCFIACKDCKEKYDSLTMKYFFVSFEPQYAAF